jgi:hypothetical protein
MNLGLDFSGKKEYEKLDFFSKTIQDANWGLVQEVLNSIPDGRFITLEELCKGTKTPAEIESGSIFQDMYVSMRLFFNSDAEIFKYFGDERILKYRGMLNSIVSRFITFAHPEEGAPSSYTTPKTNYSFDIIRGVHELADSGIVVPGIRINKKELKDYGEVLQAFNDQIFNEERYSYRSRSTEEAKRARHIIKIFGGHETSTSYFTCTRKLAQSLNKMLLICGEKDMFPIRNLDIYVDMIHSIKNYIRFDDQISYSKICQYKIKIASRNPIYEVNFL